MLVSARLRSAGGDFRSLDPVQLATDHRFDDKATATGNLLPCGRSPASAIRYSRVRK
jgi:hypothetical protein